MRDFDGLGNRVVGEAVQKVEGRPINILVHCAGDVRDMAKQAICATAALALTWRINLFLGLV